MSENASGTHVLCSIFISSPARLHHMDWCTCSTPPAGAHLWPLQLLYLEHMLGKVTVLTANGFGTLQQSHWTVSFPLELKGFPRVIKPQGACHGCPEKQENSPYMTCTHTQQQLKVNKATFIAVFCRWWTFYSVCLSAGAAIFNLLHTEQEPNVPLFEETELLRVHCLL